MVISDKIWWIRVGEGSEGPFSYLDLERDGRVTPDTFVWKEGWEEWKPLREVEELSDIFKDDRCEIEPQELPPDPDRIVEDSELTMDRSIPPWIFFWILAIIAIALYFWHVSS